MISKKMLDLINAQINEEMYSAYLYMAMSAECSNRGLNGTATWLMVQYHEEMFHAMKFYNYLLDQGGKVSLAALKTPPITFKTVKEMFSQVLKHENHITTCINSLIDLAIKEKDHASHAFLQWYVNEQVEEEKNASEILNQLGYIKEDAAGMILFDKDLGARILGVQSDFSHGILPTAAG
jgi:ferritin